MVISDLLNHRFECTAGVDPAETSSPGSCRLPSQLGWHSLVGLCRPKTPINLSEHDGIVKDVVALTADFMITSAYDRSDVNSVRARATRGKSGMRVK